MAKDYFNEVTDEKLIKDTQLKKLFFLMYIGVMAFMVGIAIYSTQKKGVDFFTYFPLFFLPLLLYFWYNYKLSVKELKKRNLK